MASKLPWKLRSHRCPIYALQVLPSPKFPPVSLYATQFSSYGTFWEIAPNAPKWPWTLKGHKMYTIYPSPDFCSGLLYKTFPIYLEFFVFLLATLLNFYFLKQVNQMTSKWPLILICQNFAIHVILAHASEISILFTLWPAVFELQVVLRKVYKMTPTMTLNTNRSANMFHMFRFPKKKVLYGRRRDERR